MKIKMLYFQENGWYVGHLQEYPDYETQGATLDELKDNLLDIYNDIKNGLVPEAKPYSILELVI